MTHRETGQTCFKTGRTGYGSGSRGDLEFPYVFFHLSRSLHLHDDGSLREKQKKSLNMKLFCEL